MKSKILIFCLFVAFCCVCDAKFHMQSIIHDDASNTCTGYINMSPFVRIGEKFYWIEDKTKLNWYGAAHECRTKGAELASIESAAEMKALSDHLLASGYSKEYWFWLAGNDLEHEGTFKWLNTGQPMYFTNWSGGQPDNNGGNENCVHLWIGNGYQMNDWVCLQSAYYICEVDAPKTVSLTFW